MIHAPSSLKETNAATKDGYQKISDFGADSCLIGAVLRGKCNDSRESEQR